MYSFGNKLKIEIEGESHTPEIRATLKGFPKGLEIDREALLRFMKRRASGGVGTTPRREPDIPEFIGGVENGVTTGEDIVICVKNTNVRPGDYSNVRDVPRPGHADYTSYVKYGTIPSGGGIFSGRMTVLLCAAGGLCLQLLKEMGVEIAAHVQMIGGVWDKSPDPCEAFSEELVSVRDKSFPVMDEAAGEKMKEAILSASSVGDSVGGIVEGFVYGLPAGHGGELFYGIEGKLSSALFGIPAVKGVEFGAGFASAQMKGSENNDPFYTDGNTVKTKTNNCGGILGGISNGMPIVIRMAVKPTPSISLTQSSVSLSRMENTELSVSGRHDACIVPRAVPVAEAVAAMAILDLLI